MFTSQPPRTPERSKSQKRVRKKGVFGHTHAWFFRTVTRLARPATAATAATATRLGWLDYIMPSNTAFDSHFENFNFFVSSYCCSCLPKNLSISFTVLAEILKKLHNGFPKRK